MADLTPQQTKALAQFRAEIGEALARVQWPAENREDATERLLEFARDPLYFERVSAFAAELLAEVVVTADPPMAMSNFSRYAHAVFDRGAFFRLLNANAEYRRLLMRLLAFSQFFADVIVRSPEYLEAVLTSPDLKERKTLAAYREEVRACFASKRRSPEAKRKSLARFRRREMLRIGIRDMEGYGDIMTLCGELSDFAQACCESAIELCWAELEPRFGRPEGAGAGTGFIVLAMGKFGGGELNFSSDIDLVFCYAEDGETSGVQDAGGLRTGRLSNREFYGRLATNICRVLGDSTSEGMLFRVDARLRPEGDGSEMARSLTSFETYLATTARAWERVAYLKGRTVAGDPEVDRKFEEIRRAFVFGSSSPMTILSEIARLKRRIDTERLDEAGRERDIKRGPGGIREIEFVVTALQILHGASHEEFRTRPTLEALARLREAGHLPAEDTEKLREAYLFYRIVEHRLQMMNDQQTQILPTDARERRALAMRCGESNPTAFWRRVDESRAAVRGCFEALFHEGEDTGSGPSLLDALDAGGTPPDEVLKQLEPYGLGTPGGFTALRELARGTSEAALGRRGQRTFERFLPELLETLQFSSDPQSSVRHLASVLRAEGGLGVSYDLIRAHPPILRLFIQTLGFGPMPAREFVAHPEWLEVMLREGGMAPNRDLEGIFAQEVAPRVANASEDDALTMIRIFKAREALFLAVKDIMGVSTLEEARAGATALADLCLREVSTVLARDVAEPWAFLAMGGYGAGRVHFVSDLDIAVVCGDASESQAVARFASRVLSAMSSVTPKGQLWKVDARLRPDGANAPLAASIDRIRRYYGNEADIWEFLSGMRLRAACGSTEISTGALTAFDEALRERSPMPDLAKAVRGMRAKMEAAHRIPRRSPFDIKQSPGGTIDVEFLVQYFQLREGLEDEALMTPDATAGLIRIAERGLIPAEDAEFTRAHYLVLRRIQRTQRLLFDTARDAFPPLPEKVEALRRGLLGQEPDVSGELDTLAANMRRMRAIFDRVVKD